MGSRKVVVLIALLILSSVSTAQIGRCTAEGICIASQFNDLCMDVKNAVPIIAFAMLLIAGIIYAAGQIMGAETRARANVWATALLTGGIIGLILAAATPYIVWFFLGTFGGSGITYDPDFCSPLYTVGTIPPGVP